MYVRPLKLFQELQLDNSRFSHANLPFFTRVFGEVDSKVAVHMEDGVMTAKIVTPEDTYHVEPSWRHFDNEEDTKNVEEDKRSMIAYKESDVLYSWNHPNADDFIPPKVNVQIF